MKALRLAAICAVAALTGSSWAQNAPTASDTLSNSSAAPPPSADVGGVGTSSAAGSGAAMVTRQQVYQDLIQSKQSGEQARLGRDTYRGN